jgi:hypothetical protein
MKGIAMILLLAASCSGDSAPPPSCQQAFTHYYDAGCVLVNLQTSQPYAVGDIITQCNQLAADVSSSADCKGKLDNWLECTAGVPDNSTTNAQCDCSQDQMALIQCQ